MEGNLAILGCGRMGEILVEALISSGAFDPHRVVATSRRSDRRDELKAKYGIMVTDSNREAADGADVVLIAVKPPDVPGILKDLARTVTRRHLVITIAAGVTTASIEAGLPMAGPIVRAMPNVAASVGEAMTAIAAGDRAAEPDLAKAEALFASVGRVVRLPEHSINTVTALSGSGPAFLAFFAQAMIEAAENLGLGPEASAYLVSQTMLGTAKLLQAEMTPAEIRQAVTSPGGTTEAGISALEQGGVARAVKAAVMAAADRAQQLSS